MTEPVSDRGRDLTLVQDRFNALAAALTTDSAGEPRDEAEFLAYTDAARAALDSLACGEPITDGVSQGGSLQVGTVLANSYVVRALIGTGGTAEVYQVRHRDLRCDYAVKILKSDRARDPTILDLFAAEARALISLRCDGIVRAYALLRHGDGRPFLVLDLARGPTLAEALVGAPLEDDDLRAMIFRLATSLEVLHADGYVHGDLSPDNVVLVGGIEGAVLLDLGLVDAGAHREIAFAGKWSSAAPEQLDGAPATAPADMYALGLLLAAAVSGSRLETGCDSDSARVARRVLPPRDLPAAWAPLIERLLHADPARRPSAREVREQLDAAGSSNWADEWRRKVAGLAAAVVPGMAAQLAPGSKTA